MQVDAGKAAKVDTDLKDETVRGMLPLFKLRSKDDRASWRKLAFPVPENIQVGAECPDCRFFLYFHLRFIEFRSVCTHANLSTNFCTDLREVQLQLNPEGTALLLK